MATLPARSFISGNEAMETALQKLGSYGSNGWPLSTILHQSIVRFRQRMDGTTRLRVSGDLLLVVEWSAAIGGTAMPHRGHDYP